MKHALAMMAALALAGCGAQDEDVAAGDESAAAKMPATVADPAPTAALRSFAGRDRDGDGMVSSVENAAAANKMFEAIDTNQDGTVTDKEYTAARVALGLTSLPGSAELIGQADQDGDGKLMLAEWIASEGKAFKAADVDRDGKLSRAEWNSMPRLIGATPEPSATPMAEAPATPE